MADMYQWNIRNTFERINWKHLRIELAVLNWRRLWCTLWTSVMNKAVFTAAGFAGALLGKCWRMRRTKNSFTQRPLSMYFGGDKRLPEISPCSMTVSNCLCGICVALMDQMNTIWDKSPILRHLVGHNNPSNDVFGHVVARDLHLLFHGQWFELRNFLRWKRGYLAHGDT